MRGKIAALAAGVMLVVPAAMAQGTLEASSKKFYDACMVNQISTEAECACAAGFYAGRLKEDEFAMIAVVVKYTDPNGDVPNMAGLQSELESTRKLLGISDARYGEIMTRFTTMSVDGAYGDKVCIPLRDR